MDYIDYKTFMKKNWENEQRSHQERLKEISIFPSNRIDNKPSEHHKNAPCRKKPNKCKIEKLQADQVLLNTLRTISERDYLKDMRKRLSNIKSLASIPRKFKPKYSNRELLEGNLIIQSKLNTVKSNFSLKEWNKQYKDSKVFAKLVAKPHVDKKLPALAESAPGRNNLIESYSLNL